MADDVRAELRLIRRVAGDPCQLEGDRTGPALSVELGEAILAVADDAARTGDSRTLDWLWDLLIYTFNEHQSSGNSSADFIDIYEYVTFLCQSLEDYENPFENPVIVQYRASIAEDLTRAREELDVHED